VTIGTSHHDSAGEAAGKQFDRRTLIKVGAWAAPALVLTTAAPAMAASGTVPKARLTLASNSIANSNTGGLRGPLVWGGGSIGYTRANKNELDVAIVAYTVIAAFPDGTTHSLKTGTAYIATGTAFSIDSITFAPQPTAAGTYRVTLTASGSGSSTTSAQSTITVA